MEWQCLLDEINTYVFLLKNYLSINLIFMAFQVRIRKN